MKIMWYIGRKIMDSCSKHVEKYKRNKEFMQIDALGDFKDWYATVGFYCSLHLIEGYLAKFYNKVIKNHKERAMEVIKESVLKSCGSSYLTLYHESIKARYYDKVFSDEDMEIIKNKLEDVEKTLIPKLA